MSGLSRTPGKRVRVSSPPRVRIPPAPPKSLKASAFVQGLFCFVRPYSLVQFKQLNIPLSMRPGTRLG
jgi:hypothetical protein